MKRFWETFGEIIVLMAVLFGCLAVGVVINTYTQVGVCYYGGGEVSFDTPDLMGTVLTYSKMPNYQDWQITPLAGGLAAGLFAFLSFGWLLATCLNSKKKNLLVKKFEFVLFAVGIAQILYGFGRLAMVLTGTSPMTSFGLFIPILLAIATLGLGFLAAAILYRKETIFVDRNPETTRTIRLKEKVVIIKRQGAPKQMTTVEEQKPMTMVEKIKKLYDEGKTEEVLKETEELIGPEPEIYGLRAWAYYRRKEFEKAREEAQKAGNNETALRCLAAIAAYVDKDNAMVRHYTDQLPETPARDNNFIIYAREPSDTTPKEEIFARALKWMSSIPQDKTNTANLLNNTARWFLAKAENKEDLVTSLGFMQAAIGLYGSKSTNLHHKASAWYWVSVIQEKLMDKSAAIAAAEMSVKFWKRQLKADPANPNYQKSLDGAKVRLKELRKILKSD